MPKLCPLKMANAQLAKEMKEDVNAFDLMNCDEDNCEWWIPEEDIVDVDKPHCSVRWIGQVMYFFSRIDADKISSKRSEAKMILNNIMGKR